MKSAEQQTLDIEGYTRKTDTNMEVKIGIGKKVSDQLIGVQEPGIRCLIQLRCM